MIRIMAGLLVLVMMLLISDSALAQDPSLERARAELQAGRDQIIREDLDLTEQELAAFWPVYQEYLARLALIRNRKATLISRFLDAYRQGEFTDEFAEWLIRENFEIKHSWAGLQEDFVPRFREVLPVQKVARFYQLENKMDAEVDAQLAIAVPLIE